MRRDNHNNRICHDIDISSIVFCQAVYNFCKLNLDFDEHKMLTRKQYKMLKNNVTRILT